MSSRATIQVSARRFDTRPRADALLPAARRPSVRVLTDLAYTQHGDERHRLDLFLPERADFPVVVFAHGGSWKVGDKAVHGTLGTFLARNGIGAALVNYRLWPRVRHPGPAQDLARAFAWVRRHAADFGGDPRRLFLCGHSAGAHSAALLGTDPGLLRGEGLSHGHVRGVIAVSGIYRIHWNVLVYGAGGVFRGADKAAASPLCNVRPGCPPFLVLHAQKEIWTLAGQARALHAGLLKQGGRSRLVVAQGEDHCSIIGGVALPSADFGREILRFIRES